MRSSNQIDFVITWVDGADPVWREKKAKHTGVQEQEGNTVVRYRDWDTLRYWFRGVEKYAPWVRYVYFVTDGQIPEWLNTQCPKIRCVSHTDYIPSEYLPTFNSNVIELNFHRIEGLSEKFVYFNDDVFLIDKTKPEDFFSGDLVCDSPKLGVLYPPGVFSYTTFNNIMLLNRHFSLRESIGNSPMKWIKGQSLSGLVNLSLYGRRDLVPNIVNRHIHMCLKKSTYRDVWEAERDVLDSTCHNKLRTKDDVTVWLVRDWQLMCGEFLPRKPLGEMFFTSSMTHSDDAVKYLTRHKGKVVCLNDSEDEADFESHRQILHDAFERILPEKCSFEK